MKRRWVLALGIGFIAAVYLLQNRKDQALNRMRFINKRFLNPFLIQFAGSAWSPIAVIHHTGRRSQKHYQTPVIVEPVENGFVFALTYGPNVDWYRNILTAGTGTLFWHEKEYALEEPEAIDAQAGISAFPPPLRAILRLIGPDHYFKMKIATILPQVNLIRLDDVLPVGMV